MNKFDIAPKGIWNAVCYAEANEPSSGEFFSVALSMDAFNSNMDAFEHYEGSAKFTAERRNSVEIDHEVQLGEGSAWAESRITAQETPSPQRDGQSMTAVALLGDFYTVEIQVGFHPETAEAAGCESIGNEACAVTATSVAEFFATSDYLETLHADIESALDEGS